MAILVLELLSELMLEPVPVIEEETESGVPEIGPVSEDVVEAVFAGGLELE